MVAALCSRLRTSRRLAEHLAAITRDHLVLGFMVRERPLPPRRLWDYLSRTAPQSVDTTLLTVADRLSAQGGGVPEEAIDGHLELAREMLGRGGRLGREGPPEPLLRGDEIAAEVGIEPGPALGEAVAELEAAQYAGEVTGRDGGDRAPARLVGGPIACRRPVPDARSRLHLLRDRRRRLAGARSSTPTSTR